MSGIQNRYYNMSLEDLLENFKLTMFAFYELQNSPIWEEEQTTLLATREKLNFLLEVVTKRRDEINAHASKPDFKLVYGNARKLLKFNPQHTSLALTNDSEFQENLRRLGYHRPSARALR